MSIVALAAVAILALGIPAKANLVANGNFESTTLSTPGGYFCTTDTATCATTTNVTDWMSSCNAGGCGSGSTVLSLLFPSTNGSAFNGDIGLDGTVANPPDDDNFVGADGDLLYSAPFWQTISGLTIGTSYTLSFEQAAAQQSGTFGATTERWQVNFGSDTQDSALMTNPSGGFQPWQSQTMTFTANATSEVLQFLAVGTPSGLPPVSLLSDVSLTTPEPSAAFLTLSMIALLGLSALRTLRKKRV